MQRALDQRLELAREDPGQGLEFDVLDGGNPGQRPVTARLGEQGDIIAGALVAIGSAKIVDPAVAQRRQLRVG